MSEEEIRKMVKDAEMHVEDDRKRKEEIEVRNRLDNLVYGTEKTLNDGRGITLGRTRENDRRRAVGSERGSQGRRRRSDESYGAGCHQGGAQGGRGALQIHSGTISS
jgi:hypothetical protein